MAGTKWIFSFISNTHTKFKKYFHFHVIQTINQKGINNISKVTKLESGTGI